MRFALMLAVASLGIAAKAEVSTFDGNAGGQAMKLEAVRPAAAAPRPRRGADGIDRVSGECRLETSGRTIQLKVVDPWMRFGMFIQGGEDGGIRATAMGWGSETVHFSIGDGGDRHAMTSLPWSAFSQGVPLELGLVMPFSKPGTDQTNEWLSCTVKMK